jgi:tRNA G18 (ribose-2'-O)-methylase SpoU
MGVERVSDVDDPRLADYRDLKDGARRRRDGTFIAESRQVVRRLLGGSRFRARSVLAAEAAAEDLRDVLTAGLPVYVAPEATLQRVVGFNFHRGCLAVGERGAELGLDGLLDARVLLVLERVSNPDNIGGAFRNAMAFGAGGVVLAPGCSDPLYRKAIRVSMGGTLVVPFTRAEPWPEALARLRGHGFTVVALTPDGGADIGELGTSRPVPERVALLLGAEGEGLSAAACAAADLAVAIRMTGRGQSLNVATALGIALHRLAR